MSICKDLRFWLVKKHGLGRNFRDQPATALRSRGDCRGCDVLSEGIGARLIAIPFAAVAASFVVGSLRRLTPTSG